MIKYFILKLDIYLIDMEKSMLNLKANILYIKHV
jgi:hypothetical protein